MPNAAPLVILASAGPIDLKGNQCRRLCKNGRFAALENVSDRAGAIRITRKAIDLGKLRFASDQTECLQGWAGSFFNAVYFPNLSDSLCRVLRRPLVPRIFIFCRIAGEGGCDGLAERSDPFALREASTVLLMTPFELKFY